MTLAHFLTAGGWSILFGLVAGGSARLIVDNLPAIVAALKGDGHV